MSPHCRLCRFLYRKRPPCREWLIGWLGNYLLPIWTGALLYWALWRFGP